MYNRYRGNSGKPERISEPKPSPAAKPPAPRQRPPKQNPIGSFIPQKLNELETEDLLLILILYLMYRESGDRDLLIIMGAMYLL